MDWIWAHCPECDAITMAVFDDDNPVKNWCGQCQKEYVTIKKPTGEGDA